MRFVEPPHLILRKHLIAGERITTFAAHVAQFSARTLFPTSLLALDGAPVPALVVYTCLIVLDRTSPCCKPTQSCMHLLSES